jgi:transcriptional regulator with XRE-family HTH domain
MPFFQRTINKRGVNMLGKRIKELRLEKGITQSELSSYLGLTPKMVSFYELQQRFPPQDIIIKLADYFNVSTDYLLGRSEIRNSDELLREYSSLYNKNPKELEEYIKEQKIKENKTDKTESNK